MLNLADVTGTLVTLAVFFVKYTIYTAYDHSVKHQSAIALRRLPRNGPDDFNIVGVLHILFIATCTGARPKYDRCYIEVDFMGQTKHITEISSRCGIRKKQTDVTDNPDYPRHFYSVSNIS